jgi:hypothetical protein
VSSLLGVSMVVLLIARLATQLPSVTPVMLG